MWSSPERVRKTVNRENREILVNLEPQKRGMR